MQEELLNKVEKALDEIRPHLNVDGGDIEIVEVTDDMRLIVKWVGNCEWCSMSVLTMRAGIEQVIKNKVPEIAAVEAVNGVNV